jgi:S1-C subfamily serine protease
MVPVPAVDPPDANLVNAPAVAAAKSSVVKIRGVAPSCMKVLEGSGFVVAPNRVIATAHQVAGSETVSVEVDGKTYVAQVVSYDPDTDVSLLSVPDLTARPLMFAETPAPTGADAVILGYFNGVSFAAVPARIREVIDLTGTNIYHSTKVTREAYTLRLRAPMEQGYSGAPLIDLNGRVLGVAFGVAIDDPETSFVLTAKEIAPQLAKTGNTSPEQTGACVS